MAYLRGIGEEPMWYGRLEGLGASRWGLAPGSEVGEEKG
jgi:hypothetical protein